MGVLGGCAVAALLGWAQPLFPGGPGAGAAEPLEPGQLIHPLALELTAPEAPPAGEDQRAWLLETVALELDGQPLAEAQSAVTASDQPVWQGEVTPGPHTLVALFVFRRDGARHDDPGARVRVERPRFFQARPGRPLALTLTRSP